MDPILLCLLSWLVLPALAQGFLYYRYRGNFRAWLGLVPFFACAFLVVWIDATGNLWGNLFNFFLLWIIGGLMLAWWLSGHFQEWVLRGELESELSICIFVWPLALPGFVIFFAARELRSGALPRKLSRGIPAPKPGAVAPAPSWKDVAKEE